MITGRARAAFDGVLAAALAAVEPGAAVREALRIEHRTLRIGNRTYDLGRYQRALVVGAGKASAPMAAAAEEVLSAAGLAVEGSVVVRYGYSCPVKHVQVLEANHPVPDQAGVQATRQIVALLQQAGPRDLVVCLVSGGGSALLTLPADGLTLEDLRTTTEALLGSGATIGEVNALRKHLDMVKGGGLAAQAPTSEWLTLVLSDVVGNPLDAIASGPTVPDSTTWQDAANVLERYSLWHRVPSPVAARIQAGLRGDIPDTPKPGAALFQRGAVHIVGSNLRACEAAASEAARRGFKTLVLTTFVEGEARDAGRLLAAFLREVHASGHPVPRPCCLVAGGETTVTLQGRGKGGRNQELALSAATVLEDLPDILLASIGTDGSDGPTDAAGAIVDGTTMRRARECGLSAADFLARNDSYAFFERLGDLVITGPTQTNVNDLYLLFAFEQAP